jgi:carbon monoxide dehydrogenase subunit G
MELEHTFTVPVGVDEAFRVLRDIERIGPCMPGATIESVDGDRFSGKVKVKVGPIQVTYQGKAAFVDVDEAAHSAVIEAKAKEARGSGTANATIRAFCVGTDADETEVRVVTELAITGKPAQFGRGVMADVGDKLLGRFADCLSEELTAGDLAPDDGAGAPTDIAPGVAPGGGVAPDVAPDVAPGVADIAPDTEPGVTGPLDPAETVGPAAGAGAGSSVRPAAAASVRRPPRREAEAIDLLDVAGGPLAKAVAPAAVALAVLLLIVWLIRRR